MQHPLPKESFKAIFCWGYWSAWYHLAREQRPQDMLCEDTVAADKHALLHLWPHTKRGALSLGSSSQKGHQEIRQSLRFFGERLRGNTIIGATGPRASEPRGVLFLGNCFQTQRRRAMIRIRGVFKPVWIWNHTPCFYSLGIRKGGGKTHRAILGGGNAPWSAPSKTSFGDPKRLDSSVPVSSKGNDRAWTEGGGGTYHKGGGLQNRFWGGILWYVFPSPEFPPPCFLWLSGSHRSTQIASDLASRAAGVRIAGQTAAGVRIAGISHRSILKNTPIFHIAGQHRRIFAGLFSGIFLWFQIKQTGFRIASKELFRIASDLEVCDSNPIAQRGCMARFGPLSLGASSQEGHREIRQSLEF